MATVYMLWEMISFVLLKNASFAFIMDTKQMEYGTIFFQQGQSPIVTIGPDGLCLGKIYIYEKKTPFFT